MGYESRAWSLAFSRLGFGREYGRTDARPPNRTAQSVRASSFDARRSPFPPSRAPSRWPPAHDGDSTACSVGGCGYPEPCAAESSRNRSPCRSAVHPKRVRRAPVRADAHEQSNGWCKPSYGQQVLRCALQERSHGDSVTESARAGSGQPTDLDGRKLTERAAGSAVAVAAPQHSPIWTFPTPRRRW